MLIGLSFKLDLFFVAGGLFLAVKKIIIDYVDCFDGIEWRTYLIH